MNRAQLIGMVLSVLPVCTWADETVVSLAPFTADAPDAAAPAPDLMHEIVLACLSQQSSIGVVERAELNLATVEATPGFTQKHTRPMQYKGVDYVMTGNVSSLDGDWLVSLQLNDPSTTQMMANHTAKMAARYDTQQLCDEAVQPLLDKFLKSKPASLAHAATQREDETVESILMMRGIAESHNGNYAKAFPYFLKILANNPEQVDARYWLAISYAKAGLAEFAREEANTCFTKAPRHAKRAELQALIANLPSE